MAEQQNVPLKQCAKCKGFFPATAEFFTKQARMKDGLRPACKTCTHAQNKIYDAAHSEEAKQERRMYALVHKDEMDKRSIDFFARVDKNGPGECWLWTGPTTRNGYGQYVLRGQFFFAHRWSYVYHKGPLTKGLQLNRLCENRLCVNPDHLETTMAWSEEEDNLIREMYYTHTVAEISKSLKDRSPSAVQSRVARLKLVRKQPRGEPLIEIDPLLSDLFLPEEGEKRCTTCGVVKPYSQFHKTRYQSDGLNSRCRECVSARAKTAPHKRQSVYSKLTPANRKRTHDLSYMYGISLEDYNQMLEEQQGVCACCGKPETVTWASGKVKPLAVDHCHTTDAIRGLLCSRCNMALGMLCENPDRIKALLKYVEDRCLW